MADWLTSGEWDVTPKRIAQRFKMEEEAVNPRALRKRFRV